MKLGVLEKRFSDFHTAALRNAGVPHGPTIIRHSGETHPPEHQHLADDLAQHMAKPDVTDDESHGLSGEFTKHVARTGNHKFILKPYFEPHFDTPPLTGWGEMTNQELYHAAGIGHLHQQVHVTEVAGQPMLAIRMAPDHITAHHAIIQSENYDQHNKALSPEGHEAIPKIGLLDFLTANTDRHLGNFMIGPSGLPLAIDHGASFLYGMDESGYDPPSSIHNAIHMRALRKFEQRPVDTIGQTAYDDKLMGWWKQYSKPIQAAFVSRLRLVKHAAIRQHLLNNFMARAEALDAAAEYGDPHGFRHAEVDVQPTEGLPKGPPSHIMGIRVGA